MYVKLNEFYIAVYIGTVNKATFGGSGYTKGTDPDRLHRVGSGSFCGSASGFFGGSGSDFFGWI